MVQSEIRFRISNKRKQQFNWVKEEQELKTYGEVVDFLLDQYLLQEQIRLSEKMISKQVSEKVSDILLENLEPMIKNIYKKTAFIDKNSQITLDMVNHLLVGENLDATYAHSIKNDPTKVYKLIVEEMSKDIENKQIKKNYREENDF